VLLYLPDGAAATYNGAEVTYMMENMKLMLTQPSLAGMGLSLARSSSSNNNCTKVRFIDSHLERAKLVNRFANSK
jgi:hypothetical protein